MCGSRPLQTGRLFLNQDNINIQYIQLYISPMHGQVAMLPGPQEDMKNRKTTTHP